MKRFFAQVAQVIKEENPTAAEKLRRASPHWMRHTHATHAPAQRVGHSDAGGGISLSPVLLRLAKHTASRACEKAGAGRNELVTFARNEERIKRSPPCVVAPGLRTENHQRRCIGIGIGTGRCDDRD